MKRKIEVDDEVFAALQAMAEPFVDTPNSVLRRVLGVDVRSPSAPDPSQEASGAETSGDATEATVYRLEAPGISATAERIGEHGMRMLSATSDLRVLPSLSASNRAIRHRLLADGAFIERPDGTYELSKPTDFPSPSAGSSVLLGRESNGRAEWKDARGRPLGAR
ncbi:DUF4357 domain-containing protein [Agromyces sp. ZXT2-3]|uniref:DUF4357 domain-containing protein n=1 Tax=Agromyces sp. ZXT2-3 TaxID=3461152 RepID=UPI004054EC42